MAAEQAKPAIAVAGVAPVTGDAPCKGAGETSRSEWRLGVCHFCTRTSAASKPLSSSRPFTRSAASRF